MNEPESFQQFQEEQPQLLPPQPLTFLERHGIPPLLFGLAVLAMMVIAYHIIGGLVTIVFFGWDINNADSNALRISQAIGQIVLMLIPTFFLVRLVSLEPKSYLRLGVPNPLALVHAIVGVFSLQQVLQVYLYFQDMIPLPHAITELIEKLQLKEQYEQMIQKIVGADSVPELLFVLLVIAIVPAIVEEMFFRGLIQRTFENILTPVRGYIFTGIVFGIFHVNPFQVVPLAALGVYLGFLTYKSNSIWTSVSAHFFNNGLACIAVYLHIEDDSLVAGDPAQMPVQEVLLWFLVMSAIFTVSTYLFIKATQTSKAPNNNEGITSA